MAPSRLDVAAEVLRVGTRVLVLGYAREGSSAADFLAQRGVEVTVSDRSFEARVRAGSAVLEPESGVDLRAFDALVVSPGIPDDNSVLMDARGRGLLVTNATQLFLELCPCPVVGVTGSSGKSTTTSLIAAILRQDGRRDVGLGGNIGNPMLDLLTGLSSESIAVVEMSSFQLQIVSRSPHVAVVTNLSPNHLDRHGTMAAYAEAKRQIFAHQDGGDFAVVNGDDPAAFELMSDSDGKLITFGWERRAGSGAFVRNGQLVRIEDGVEEEIVDLKELGIPGRHNVENALAAAAATGVVGASAQALREVLRSFRGLPHRLQSIRTVNGVTYVDDSIATSPERVAVGMCAIEGPIVWIAGGRSKHLPWDSVLDAGTEKVQSVILIGEAASEVADVVAKSWPGARRAEATSMTDAISQAAALARPGDTVLLSPGGTSFDWFGDFEERGRAFEEAVERL